MNVFEFAMKMEKDGQAFYETQSAKSSNAALKKIWDQLAHDEIKHYEIFRRLRDGEIKEAEQMAKLGTDILGRVKTVFENLAEREHEFEFGEDVIAAWMKAGDLEQKTEAFYREKEAEESKPEVKRAFHLLADEEQKHVRLIEHVLNFLNQPKSWLDDAEWSNLGTN